jgi:hypothetical protein
MRKNVCLSLGVIAGILSGVGGMVLGTNDANAQYYLRRGSAPVMRPLPRPVMRPAPLVRHPYHPSTGARIPGQAAGTTPVYCDRFRCYVY